MGVASMQVCWGALTGCAPIYYGRWSVRKRLVASARGIGRNGEYRCWRKYFVEDGQPGEATVIKKQEENDGRRCARVEAREEEICSAKEAGERGEGGRGRREYARQNEFARSAI